MGNSVAKFSVRSRKAPIGDDPHWDYCCNRRIPHILITKSGTIYWKVAYDILPLTMFERFVVIDYTEHTIPFYDQYCSDFNFPLSKKAYSGSGGCLMFTVNKKDAIKFAENLYDLLVVLSIKDKELFDKNPFYISENGYNSEGIHVGGYVEELEKMSDQELHQEFEEMTTQHPHWLQTIQLIKNEMNRRKELKDLSVQELRSLSAKEKGKIYANAFLKNINSQPSKK